MTGGIGDWLRRHRHNTPDRIALREVETGASWTFADLDRRTDALAAALRAQGTARGDRVGLVTVNSAHMLEVIFAVAKLGAVAVPINVRLSAEEIQYILTDSGAGTVFVSAPLAATAAQATAGTQVTWVVQIPAAAQRREGTDSEFEQLISGAPQGPVTAEVDGGDLAMLMYTSGTTGKPKGAMLTHDNMLWNAINSFSAAGEGLYPRDVNLSAAPLFHIGALGIFTLPLLYAGGTTVIMEAFTPEAWLDAVEQYRPTVSFCVPAMWAAIDAAPSIGKRDLSSLRYVLSGGAPCPLVLIESLRTRGLNFLEGFGLTETAPIVSVLASADVVDNAGSIGKPVMHVDLRVVDEQGAAVPTGEVGELAIRGPNVFVGYWNRPDATAEAIVGGWFLSGDLATCDEAGYYRIVDRKKDMIISGGENVYATEVEQVLYRHPEITEVAVVGRPDPQWGEAVAAVVVRTAGSDLSEESLIAWTRERLAGFKTPRTVVFTEALPRTATGKVLKRQLRTTWSEDGEVVQR